MLTRRHLHHALLLGFAFMVAFSWHASWFPTFDNLAWDKLHVFAKKPATDELLIIAIDEKSLAELGRWPWSRKVHAELIKQLSQADIKAAVVDIIFAEPDSLHEENDRELIRAIVENAKIILPVYFERLSSAGQLLEVTPIVPLMQASAETGHAHLSCDRDGICRALFLKEGLGSPHWPHLSLALYQFLNTQIPKVLPGERAPAEENFSAMLLYRDYYNLLPLDKAGTIARVSYVDVLNGNIPASMLQGKTVFVGATASGIHDTLSTPAGRVPGVELNAMAYASLSDGKLIKPSRSIFVAILLSFIFIVVAYYFSLRSPLTFLLGMLAASVLSLVMSVLCLRWFLVWVSPVSIALAWLAFYPVWSWLRLELALSFLRTSIKRINDEEQSLHDFTRETASVVADNEKLLGRRSPNNGAGAAGEIVENTIAHYSRSSESLARARSLILQSLSHLQEGVALFDEAGGLVLVNAPAKKLFKNIDTSWNLTQLGEALFGGKNEVWEQKIAQLSQQKKIEFEVLHSQEILARDLFVLGQVFVLERDMKMYLFSFADITEIKQSENQRREMMEFISHDLRSPLVSILALTENTLEGKADKTLLEKISDYAKTNLELSESLLQVNKAQALQEASFQLCDLRGVIDEAVLHAKSIADKKKVAFVLQYEDDDIFVDGNAELLRRVFMNLFNNALRFAPQGSDILVRVKLCQQRQMVDIQVEDEGPGISEADFPHLFEKFKRGLKTTSTSGAGLGLFFVKTVTQKHGGHVRAENRAQGGARFCLSIPFISL